jgi:hypothetical protein
VPEDIDFEGLNARINVRQNEDGESGDATQLQFAVKYRF